MAKRYLYLVDEETGARVGRWPVEGMDAAAIHELERKILSECGDGVVLRDSQFDLGSVAGRGGKKTLA